MSLLFPQCTKLDSTTEALLADAYELACDKLTSEHHVSPTQLGPVIDRVLSALMDFYHAGQRDEAQLAQYAV